MTKYEVNENMKQTTNTIQEGDILETSWGYDQTNYDFIIVEKVSPTGKTAICKQATSKIVAQNGFVNSLKPIAQGIGKPFRMKIAEYNGQPRLRGTYCKSWNNGETSEKFRAGSFAKCEEGKTYGETDTQFGH